MHKWRGKTREVVMAQKHFIPGAERKSIAEWCIGNDLSKAFDTVNRLKVLEILIKRNWARKDQLGKNAPKYGQNLPIKSEKQKRRTFSTSLGVPQDDATSLSTITLHLDEALREFDSLRIF